VLLTVFRLARRKFWPSYPARISSALLTSPAGDPNLTQLESNVILSALGASLLPISETKAKSEAPLSASEASHLVEDYRHADRRTRMWTWVWRVVSIIGSLAWLGTQIAQSVIQKDWVPVIFPVSHQQRSIRYEVNTT
jgi:hypothetical protein